MKLKLICLIYSNAVGVLKTTKNNPKDYYKILLVYHIDRK